MKKTIYAILLCISLAYNSNSQTLNQITLIPPYPSNLDTIKVITDFSYLGNCAYGMVSLYTSQVGSNILVVPTYCGYGDSTLCNSIDTLVIDPRPAGNYTISVEFHQGSVCPLSGFDILLMQFDTSITIYQFLGFENSTFSNENKGIQIFPNPITTQAFFNFDIEQKNASINISDVLGNQVQSAIFSGKKWNFERGDLKSGIYFLRVTNDLNNLVSAKILLQ